MRDQAEAGRAIGERGAEDRHLFSIGLQHDAGAGLGAGFRQVLPISRMNSRDEYGRGSSPSAIF